MWDESRRNSCKHPKIFRLDNSPKIETWKSGLEADRNQKMIMD